MNKLGLTIFVIGVLSSTHVVAFDVLNKLKSKVSANDVLKTLKGSSYKSGDVIEVIHGASLLKTMRTKVPASAIKQYKKGNNLPWDMQSIDNLGAKNYGMTGPKLSRNTKDVLVPLKWNKVLSNMDENDLPPWHEIKDAQLGYRAKIVKLSNKECFDKKLKKARCSSISYLREELEFVDWLPETKEFFESVVKKGLMIQSKNEEDRKKAKALARKADKYKKSAQSSSDLACIAQAKYSNAKNYVAEVKKNGTITYKAIQISNQLPVFKSRLNGFKSEYKKRAGKAWSRKCPSDYNTIVERVKKDYGIFLL